MSHEFRVNIFTDMHVIFLLDDVQLTTCTLIWSLACQMPRMESYRSITCQLNAHTNSSL